MSILVTGSAGFIGFHLCKRLLLDGKEIIGLDNLNEYYDPKLKNARIHELKKISKISKTPFTFIKGDLEDEKKLLKLFKNYKPRNVVHLAAQAGVRYSLINPNSYIQSNIVGFNNIIECCRNSEIEHLLYASSSSVYGGNTKLPFSEDDNVDHPVSLYAASKKSNELVAHAYSHLFGIPVTGLRFFTIYGPWGRPDMALSIFTKSILNNEPIKIFNYGKLIRDFTYIDDVIESLLLLIEKIPKKDLNFNFEDPNPSQSWAPYKVFNIGNSNPINIEKYIEAIEFCLCKKAIKDYLPMQAGDVQSTAANCEKLKNWINYKPNTSIRDGVAKFVEWYKNYY